MITTPQLPPRKGYVEVEIDGVRQYQKVYTEEERRMEALEANNRRLTAQNQALIDQNDFQEELIVELANIVYA